MTHSIYQVDAFTSELFKGNPAAVVPLEKWLPEEAMQNIALENNLSETAFFVQNKNEYDIRWFTPKAEVDLCGHATIATAFVIKNFIDDAASEIHFNSKSGPLKAAIVGDYIQLDFPAIEPSETPIVTPQAIINGCDKPIQAVHGSEQDYLVVLDSADAVRTLTPDLNSIATLDNRGVIFTAKGDDCDFVSRCFFPKYDVDEDPVTGSAHCVSAPYWSKVLNKNSLIAKQLSNRGGEVRCEIQGDRVLLSGKAVLYMQGTINV